MATVIACAYRLMTSFPLRFPENDRPESEADSIWGHSHNNWQSALMCVQFFKNYRGKAMINFAKKSREIVAKWQGLSTDSDAVEAVQQGKDDTDYVAGFDMAFETDDRIKGLLTSSISDFDPGDATSEQIMEALGLKVGADENMKNSLGVG